MIKAIYITFANQIFVTHSNTILLLTMRILLIIALFFSIASTCFAQIPQMTESQARQELKDRNLDQEELRKRLLERGFDIDNLDPTNLEQLNEFEGALRDVVAEMEAEAMDKENSVVGSNGRNKKQPTSEKEKAEKEKAEKERAEDLKEVAKNSSEDIQDAVEDGATIDEAIAEELIDAQEDILPEAEVFGQHIFREKSIKLFRKSNDVKPPKTYILGVGDEVGVSIFGYSQESLTFEINDEGYILPPSMSPIYLKGLSFGESKKVLKNAFGQHYRFEDNEFQVTLNFSRTISVNIVGEVFNYGSFTIPAINNAFNALVAAGGPSDIGSVRNIQLIRSGSAPVKIDIYEYLMNPKDQPELYLMENDYIHVPVAERIVSISGLVNRPFKYELKNSEGLLKLVEYAGGFSKDALLRKVQVKRFSNDEQLIFDVDYRELVDSNSDFPLFNGDEISIERIPKPYDNYVELEGAVELEGRYALKNKMRVSDLLARTKLIREARNDVAFLRRINEDLSVKYIRVNLNTVIADNASPENIILQTRDKLIVFEQSNFVDKTSFIVNGAVRHPNKFEYDINQNIKIEEAIIMTGGLTQDAADVAYIYRKDPQRENSVEYVRVNIREAISNPNSIDNRWLEANDSLVVFSKDYFRDNTSVRVLGAVRYPGFYPYDVSLKLKDILTLSGGLQIVASKSKIDVYRLEFKGDQETRTIAATLEVDDDFNVTRGADANFQLKPFDNIVVRNAPEFEMQKLVRISGEVKYPGEYALLDDNETVTSLIKRAGGLTSEAFAEGATLNRSYNDMGYVIMELDEAMKNNQSRFNYIMKSEDVIEIPKKKDLVSIIGETQVSEFYPDKIVETGRINVAFDKGKNARHYVDKYSGISKNGRKRLISVEHANGQVERTKNYIFFRKYPEVKKGSTIMIGNAIVENNKDKNQKDKKKIDWGDVFSNSIAQATSILSLILLIQRVN